MFFCTNFKHSNLILRYLMKHKLNTDRMRDIYLTMMQVVTRFERRQNNSKNDNVTLCKVQIYNAY